MRFRWLVPLLLASLLFSLGNLPAAQAARGAPGSYEFGHGAHINLDGPQVEQALQLAGTLRLDWLTADLSWSAMMPDPTAALDFSVLDQVMKTAGQNQIAVMLSITQPPVWAMTEQGPNANLTAVFIQMLAGRFPGVLQAIELFPGANTPAGWGTSPNPAAYWGMFATVQARLQENGIGLNLIAAGLEVLPADPGASINEVDFLRGLYQAGANNLPVISLRYTDLTGQPADPAQGGETRILRRYEALRQVMVENNQANAMLWITRLGLPDGTINPGELQIREAAQQSAWLSQAAAQLRAQLFIGMAVMADLNPVNPARPAHKTANLLAGGSHPFTKVFREIIQQNDPGIMGTPPGRVKTEAFNKLRP